VYSGGKSAGVRSWLLTSN